MATLSQQLGKMNINAIQTNVVCDHCAGNHSSVDCQMGNPFSQLSYGQANYVSNFQEICNMDIRIFLRQPPELDILLYHLNDGQLDLKIIGLYGWPPYA